MPENIEYELTYDDYAQSANALFNFMQKPEYLKEILKKKAIVPRYCRENMGYLNIDNNEMLFKEIAVLQKCFCDIPFHKLMERFRLEGIGENYQNLTEEEKSNNTHTDFYGRYGIAFSKAWGEKNNLQPVHYLNEQSQYTKAFSKLLRDILKEDDVLEIFANDILGRLSFVKPLRGIMKRRYKREHGDIEVEVYKNFHDEQEWRYVPENQKMTSLKMESIIANPNLLEKRIDIDINKGLTVSSYSSLWLKYNYDEIRYIIVPDSNGRIDIIHTIMSIPEENFNSQIDIEIQKYVLVSKILVLDEIGKDW